jgi:hypothetical protein
MHRKFVRRYRATLRLTAAVLGAAVMVAAAPGVAHAACNQGDFCLWENNSRGGGSYHFDKDDANLHNDRFRAGVPVGDNASSVFNNGKAVSSGYDDVWAFKDTNFGGPKLCVPLQSGYSRLKNRPLAGDHDKGASWASDEPDGTWNDDISSYHWITFCLP